MSDRLRSFLETHGLADYLELFLKERIEPEDIPLLSDEDLVGLGLPLGPRRRLLRAVADAGSASTVHERRNLTVLFCDMVDSTVQATRLDPEDLQTRFHDFRAACEAAIAESDGFIANSFGDGLMAYFGYPAVLEDAALCAVRAGLGLVERCGQLRTCGGAVAVRVGIASGLTVIETRRALRGAPEEVATGATLALAARLQAEAGPGEVVVSDSTRRLVQGTVQMSALGARSLKGFSERLAVWRVEGLASSPLRDSGELLGRDAERAVLFRMMAGLSGSGGGAVLIEGEAGIGKSRLLGELAHAAPAGAEVVRLQCSRAAQTATLRPVLEWLERVVAGAEDPMVALSALPGATPDNLAVLARMAGVAAASDTEQLAGKDLRGAVVEAAVAILAGETGGARLLLVEDLHWADAETRRLLRRLAACAGSRGLLLAATTRPRPGVSFDAFHRIALAPLDAESTISLIAAQEGAEALSAEVREIIVTRSCGVPLFAEELTRALLEAPETPMAVGGEVPFTLQDTLMARLDRLPHGKSVAQMVALIAPSVSRPLLHACCDMSDQHVDSGLEELLTANLLERQPGSADTFGFRHVLMRDTAYGSLLLSRRAALHLKVARTMETAFPELAEQRPEAVAAHFAMASDTAAAGRFWEKAADQALARATPASAVGFFERALAMLEQQPASASRNSRAIALRIRLNMALTVTTGFASHETEHNLASMAELFDGHVPGESALQLLWSRSMSALVRADLVLARRSALQFDHAARRSGLRDTLRMAQRFLGYVSILEGELPAAETLFHDALDGYAPEGFDPILPGHPFDVLAASLSQRAILRALQDRPEAVERDQERALSRAESFDDSATSFQVLVHLCLARFELGDSEGVLPLLTDLRRLVDRSEIAPLYINIWDGWLAARNGALDEGLAAMGAAQAAAMEYALWMPRISLLRVQLLCEAGRTVEALTLLETCDHDIERFRHFYLRSEALRLRALCRAQETADPGEVLALLDRAETIARAQGARRFERAVRRDLVGLDPGGDHRRRGRSMNFEPDSPTTEAHPGKV